jgi:hypothetical protein
MNLIQVAIIKLCHVHSRARARACVSLFLSVVDSFLTCFCFRDLFKMRCNETSHDIIRTLFVHASENREKSFQPRINSYASYVYRTTCAIIAQRFGF